MPPVMLRNGQTLEVQPVSPLLLVDVEAAYPLPAADSAEFMSALATRSRQVRATAFLAGLPEVQVPDGWQFPAALAWAGITPRPGPEGRRADYIEYELLRDPADLTAVQQIIFNPGLTEAEIGVAAQSFPGASPGR